MGDSRRAMPNLGRMPGWWISQMILVNGGKAGQSCRSNPNGTLEFILDTSLVLVNLTVIWQGWENRVGD